MKKILLSLLLLLSTVAISQAQGHKMINLGVKAGVNVNSISELTNLSSSAAAGFTGGVFFELRPIKWFGIGVDALYSMSDFELHPVQVDNSSMSARIDLGYIDLPIMLKFYLLGGLSINAGVMPSFLVGSSIRLSDNSDVDVSFNTTNFAIPVGVSYQFSFGLTLDARYNFGLSDINKEELVEGHQGARLSAFSFMVGWRF